MSSEQSSEWVKVHDGKYFERSRVFPSGMKRKEEFWPASRMKSLTDQFPDALRRKVEFEPMENPDEMTLQLQMALNPDNPYENFINLLTPEGFVVKVSPLKDSSEVFIFDNPDLDESDIDEAVVSLKFNQGRLMHGQVKMERAQLEQEHSWERNSIPHWKITLPVLISYLRSATEEEREIHRDAHNTMLGQDIRKQFPGKEDPIREGVMYMSNTSIDFMLEDCIPPEDREEAQSLIEDSGFSLLLSRAMLHLREGYGTKSITDAIQQHGGMDFFLADEVFNEIRSYQPTGSFAESLEISNFSTTEFQWRTVTIDREQALYEGKIKYSDTNSAVYEGEFEVKGNRFIIDK